MSRHLGAVSSSGARTAARTSGRSTLTPEQAIKAWGQFDKTLGTEYYPAVNLGYSGTAMIRGSRMGGMVNDNIRGMPTFGRMYLTD